jgi:4-amino-4-deoxy-L-arabinose transferase-like glycosyltransferase
LLPALLVAQAVILSININRQWTGHHDWNSAVWAQAARNNLRAGLTTTWGVPASLYYGPLPIPAEGYYVHHPPALPLAVTAMFALWGEHEWAARLVPIVCSLVSTVLLWLVTRRWAGARTATLSALVWLLLPMELYFGRMINHEPCALMWMLAVVWALQHWELSGRPRWAAGMFACLFLGLWTAWSVYIFSLILAGYLLARRRHFAAIAVLATVAVAALLFLVQIRAVRVEAWQDFFQATTRQPEQISSGHRYAEKLSTLFVRVPPAAWVLALIGSIYAARQAGLRGLNVAAGGLFLTAAVFIVGVRHKVPHDYWGFYFIAPVAMMGGVGLDALLRRRMPGGIIAVVLAAWLARDAVKETVALENFQYHILDWIAPEPKNLIPELGERISKTFPQDAKVLCNFLPYPQPQLEYYARRVLIPAQRDDDWRSWINRPDRPIGGVIWLEVPGADELVTKLPQGSREIVEFGPVRFLFWKKE